MTENIFTMVDRYLRTELEARSLQLAFKTGVIDHLSDVDTVAVGTMRQGTGMSDSGFRLFIDLLTANDVLEGGGCVGFSPGFRKALAYRDLLEARLWFANLVAPDVHELFEQLLCDIPQFMERAKVFDLFRYDRCFDVTPENIALSRRWVDYTTTLTKYEAPSGLALLDLSQRRFMLDIGGNSGEFARNACRVAPELEATVFDLPVVCAIGSEHVARFAESARVRFHPGDLRRQDLPSGHDLISFKSVLHDWPDDHAEAFLAKAADALEPGGQLVIFERMPIGLERGRLEYSMVANLVFLPFFREPAFYLERLGALGFTAIAVRTVDLEMPFMLITADKKR